MEVLDLGIIYETINTITFRTNVIVRGDGTEQRNILWSEPVLRFDVGDRDLNNAALNYIRSFHSARKGSYETFLFRDWSDSIATNQSIGTGNGSLLTFQLKRTYSVSGGYSGARTIRYPIPNSVSVYIGGVKQTTGWTVGAETGIITFTSAPTGAITADFSFYCLVRFEQDTINYQFKAIEPSTNTKIYELKKLTLIEIKELETQPFTINQWLSHAIDLGYDIETLSTQEANTSIYPVAGGFEKRVQNWDNPLLLFEIGQRTLTETECTYLLSLFRICRGRGSSFSYQDWASEALITVRFGSDSLSTRFDAWEPSTGRAIFYLSGMSLKQTLPHSGTINLTHVFGTYTMKGGPWNGSSFYCNGGCNVGAYFRTLTPVRNLENIGQVSFGVINGYWYIWHINQAYQIDFIYPNNYLAHDLSNNRGYPAGPFSPHGIGIISVDASAPCVQDDGSSPAYGTNPIADFIEVLP